MRLASLATVACAIAAAACRPSLGPGGATLARLASTGRLETQDGSLCRCLSFQARDLARNGPATRRTWSAVSQESNFVSSEATTALIVYLSSFLATDT